MKHVSKKYPNYTLILDSVFNKHDLQFYHLIKSVDNKHTLLTYLRCIFHLIFFFVYLLLDLQIHLLNRFQDN